MKRIGIIIALVLCIPTLVLALDFAPEKLTLSAPEVIEYDFDGTSLDISVKVSGTTARTTFLVYTKEKGQEIGELTNGNLGWHYVNKIDTCVYISPVYDFGEGSNTVAWDGKDNDGGTVPEGEYTYYMWAYDFTGQKQRATYNDLPTSGRNNLLLQEIDADGLPLDNPFFQGITGSIAQRWVLGNDPLEIAFLETSDFAIPEEWSAGGAGKNLMALNPDDHNISYKHVCKAEPKTVSLFKYNWVPNGPAERDTKWGEEWAFNWDGNPGVVTDGNYLYTGVSNIRIPDPMAQLLVVDIDDGTLVENITLEKGWIRPDEFFRDNPANYLNGGPAWFNMRQGKLFMGYWFCCFQMTDPGAYLESGDIDDLYLWMNQNGDYINDRGWTEDHETPWLCFAEGPPHVSCFHADENLFSISPQFDMGAVTFAMMGPDGTGFGPFAFAGETAGYKNALMFCQNGSAFDGLYTDNSTAPEEVVDKGGMWFIGHDSINGVITNSPVAVDEAGPAAFSVAQNSPNPFNPTTTISFAIPEAGNVSFDVFNVAGQKVDTIANEFMSAGSHSVTWDASGFSAGVYFYTVKSGDFTRTMKMTLLK